LPDSRKGVEKNAVSNRERMVGFIKKLVLITLVMALLLFPHGTSAEDISRFTKAAKTYTTVQLLTTGYTANDPGETGNGITKTGIKAKYGTCAVDPKVFPFGTKFYVPGYGVAVADDTGGAIKGNRIDLFFDSKDQAFHWGMKRLPVTLISK